MKKSILLIAALAFGALMFASFTSVEKASAEKTVIESVANMNFEAPAPCFTQEDLEAFLECYGVNHISCQEWDFNNDHRIDTADLLYLLGHMCP